MDLAELLAGAARTVAFTGAGISTESGIPDFRSPGGLWTRYDPRQFTFPRYVESAETRKLSWQMRREFWATAPRPNAGHRALAELEATGRLLGVVTQNIDGLHQAAGSRSVVELHGTAREVLCIGAAPRGGTPDGCGFRTDTRWAFDRLDAGDEDPACPRCGGLVKSATVSFGQAMDAASMGRAATLFAAADLVLAIGSSLEVYPAAALPEEAARRGVPLVIVNAEPTPLDGIAHLVLRGQAGKILSAAVARVAGS